MIWLIVAAVLIAAITWALSDEEHPVDKLPGPPRYPVIGCVLSVLKYSNPRDIFRLVRDFHLKYGDRYLIKVFKRRIVHISTPADIEILLSNTRNITKGRPYTFLQPWLGTGLLISTGIKWHQRRKILTPTFHFNILKNFATVIEEKSRDMVNKLMDLNGEEVDLFPVVSDFTIYTICETAMGTQLNETAATAEYKSAILEIGDLMLYRVLRFWLHNSTIFNNLPIGRRFNKVLSKAQAFAEDVILERKKQRMESAEHEDGSALEGEELGSKKRMAMLDLLLEAESKGQIDLEGIREEVNTFMFEGHDTTATALTFGLMLLADHEDVQERIYEECQRVLGNSDDVPTVTALAEMKYLEAVIKETLRLYPSVSFISRSITEDLMLGDLLIKKGEEVGIHIYDLHRRKDLYDDPEAFRPERFLNGEVKNPYAYVPFSAGLRNCIGQRFAMQEMKCLLAEVVRRFKLQPRTKGWRPRLAHDMVLRSVDPIYVKFIRR